MWKEKIWKFTEATVEQARAKRNAWIARYDDVMEWEVIFVNNAFGITYRKLRIIR